MQEPLRTQSVLQEFVLILIENATSETAIRAGLSSVKPNLIFTVTSAKIVLLATNSAAAVGFTMNVDDFGNKSVGAIWANAGTLPQITTIDESGAETIPGVGQNGRRPPTIAVAAYAISRHSVTLPE